MKLDCPIREEVYRQIEALEPEIRHNQLSALARRVWKATEQAAKLPPDAPTWLWKLALKGKDAELSEEDSKAMIAAMTSDNGQRLLLQYLKSTKSRATPVSVADIREQMLNSEMWLLRNWLAPDGKDFLWSCCFYNDQALAKLLAFALKLNESDWNDKRVRKICERLGLKKSRILLFRDIEVREGAAFPVFFRKLLIQPDD